MKIIQYSNGPEGTENSSNQNSNAGVQTPANGSYQQSLYIAAIAQFIGCEGLASPAIATRDGVGYAFDFYHAQCGKLFKVLKGDDLSEYEKYTQYPGDVFVIVDVENQPHLPVGLCAACDEAYIFLPRVLGEKLHDIDVTLVYFQRHLWEYSLDTPGGNSQWSALEPVVLQELDDEEIDGDKD